MIMEPISVQPVDIHSDPLRFEVRVGAGPRATVHMVTVSAALARRLGADRSPETLLTASFRFLLDREPKESILRAFDLSIISRYFPEYEQRLGDYWQ